MNFIIPDQFPQDTFQEFGKCASELFPGLMTEEAANDPLQRQDQFLKSWAAVRYRCRACSEANEEFKALFANATEFFREWNSDEEYWYKIERCLYTFFMNGLSVFESFGYCLYFVGNAINPQAFVHVAEPKKITLRTTSDAFCAAFPHSAISDHLAALRNDSEFCKFDSIRNILAHRISGMRSVRSYSVRELDGTFTGSREDVLHLYGTDELQYDEELIQRHLNGLTAKLTVLIRTALELLQPEKTKSASG